MGLAKDADRLDYTLGRVPGPKRSVYRHRRPIEGPLRSTCEGGQCLRKPRAIASRDEIRMVLERLHPFGLVAKRYTRTIQEIRLFLQAPRIRKHPPRTLNQRQHVEIAQRAGYHQVRSWAPIGQLASQDGGCARMHG